MAECKDLIPSFCGAKMQITFPEICNEYEPSDEICEAIICQSKIACDDEPSNKACEAITCQSSTQSC